MWKEPVHLFNFENPKKKSPCKRSVYKGFSYVREKIRTPGLLVRSQTLYPAELHAHIQLGIMPATGIEPVREYKSRRILSPVRLPVPPRRHNNFITFQIYNCNS